jgi:hypothetical protein
VAEIRDVTQADLESVLKLLDANSRAAGEIVHSL